MNIYLMETYDSEIQFDKESNIIALTPEVCYQLDKKGIKYSIIEDYYSEEELLKHEEEYDKFQRLWIDKLDEFLQNNVPELREYGLKLATIYHFFLKTFMLDSLYIRCYQIKKIVEKINPTKITFISYKNKEKSLDHTLSDSDKSCYSQIVPIICRERKISLEKIYVNKSIENTKQSSTAKVNLREIEILRNIFLFYKYGLKSFFQKQKNDEKSHILLFKMAHIGYDFIFEALGRGHEIYQLSGNFIIKYSPFGERKYLDINISKENYDDRWERAAKSLDNDNIINWINDEYGFDVSEIILPKLQYFIRNVCPEILKFFKFFIDFYEKEKIDFVMTPHEWPPREFAAIAAANSVEDTKSVCILHGNEAFVNKFWYNHEMRDYNICICTDAEIKEHFHEICKQNNYLTDIRCSSHRLLNVKKIGYLRNLQKTVSKEKQRIIYLPAMLRGDTRTLERSYYPDNWYYKFQKTLIEYFSTKKNYTFVWKGLPQADHIYNPIPDFIKDNRFDNIEIATNPFIEHLLTADRVICDYPSTGFYESVVAGVPTMSLYHRSSELRKTALDYFGDILKPYSNVQEAIEKIEEFLKSEPKLYTTTIDMEDKSIVQILEENKQIK